MVYLLQKLHANSERAAMSHAHISAYDGLCPVCGQRMVVTRLSCAACGSELHGAFALSQADASGPTRLDEGDWADRERSRFGRLSRLDDSQLEFVEAFLRCRGIIKNVEDMLGISYPTVRARLNNVLETMGFATAEDVVSPLPRRRRRDILADLALGKISTEEAHRLLAQAQSTGDDGDE